jgi:hypothetical protein
VRAFRAACIVLFLAGPALVPTIAQRAAPVDGAKLQLTIDSIMRGPNLVGWPPTALRWSADSQKLYFEWRKPGEKEASTPAANGRWDKAHQRLLYAAAYFSSCPEHAASVPMPSAGRHDQQSMQRTSLKISSSLSGCSRA